MQLILYFHFLNDLNTLKTTQRIKSDNSNRRTAEMAGNPGYNTLYDLKLQYLYTVISLCRLS